MRNIWNDLKFALRQLRRSPGFAVTAILTLALGIGANTAIFSLLDQALLRSLPVKDPGALVVFKDSKGQTWRGGMSMSGSAGFDDVFSYPTYLQLRDHGKGFSGVLATLSTASGLMRNNSSQFVNVEIVSGNYFDVLGVRPALGRTLHAFDDGVRNANPEVVISYDFWRGKLGADSAVVGSTVNLGGHPFQVIGVSAPRFKSAVWGQTSDLFIPMSVLGAVVPGESPTNDRFQNHSYKWLSILARLSPGVTAAEAQADNAPLWHAIRVSDLALLGSKISANFSTAYLSSTLEVLPGSRGFDFNRTSLEKPFLAVMAMAVLVLLIASVNVASLLMVRSAGRVREFSLRAALGASSARVVAQLLLEGLLIGVCGGVVGLLLAPFALHVLVGRLADSSGNNAFSTDIDHRVLLFNFAVAIVVSLLFSLVPALQLRKPNLTSTLREATGTGAGGLLQLRRIIVCLQIGLSVVLLVGAGLFIRTMQQLRHVDLGFNVTHLLDFSIDPHADGYTEAQIPAVQQRVLDGLAAMPGFVSVAGTDDPELLQNSSFYNINVSGYVTPPDDTFQIDNTVITLNYLDTLGVPLLAGRELSDTDTMDHPLVALVNESFVKHYCNGNNQSCLGRFIQMGTRETNVNPKLQIVGVVHDYKHRGVQADNVASCYEPLKQTPPTDANPQSGQLYIYLRTKLPAAQEINSVRNAMHRIDPSLSLGTMETVSEQIDDTLQNQRIIELLAISFGVLATLLAGVGLYGVLAYSTAQRTREIGIRMALGSTRLAVSRLILTDVFTLAAIGVAIAIPTAYGLSVLIRSQLFGVSAADPAILTVVV